MSGDMMSSDSTPSQTLKGAPDFVKECKAAESKCASGALEQNEYGQNVLNLRHELRGECFCKANNIVNCLTDEDLRKFICDRDYNISLEAEELEMQLQSLRNSPEPDFDAIRLKMAQIEGREAVRADLLRDYQDLSRVRQITTTTTVSPPHFTGNLISPVVKQKETRTQGMRIQKKMSTEEIQRTTKGDEIENV